MSTSGRDTVPSARTGGEMRAQARLVLYVTALVAAVSIATALVVEARLARLAGTVPPDQLRQETGAIRLALLLVALAAAAVGGVAAFALGRGVARRLAELARLERRSRDLHHIHGVGLELADASQSEGVLGLMAEAARTLTSAEQAQVVAQIGSRDRPWWASPASPPFTIERRKALEAELGRARAQGSLALPAELPAGTRAVTVAHGGKLFGWIFVVGGPEPSEDTRDLLCLLSGQAATTLRNIQLLEERLESERLSTVGRMISTIVHDFRNPMTAIRGYAAMIEEVDLGPERRKGCARLVVEETERLSGMIDEILEFTRGGPARLSRRAVGLDDLVARLQRLIEPDLGRRGIRFSLDLAYTGAVSVDADRMLRAMLNIAGNALDAMPAGGTFAVRSSGRDGRVEIGLSDDGHGIPEELQPRIYEPFFTHGKPRGIGLGMSIARRIVEEHGGSIRLDSEVGRGTCFTVSLPLDAAPPLEARRAAPATPSAS
ncbi:MAG TPA: ATP-binding protein [Vicinamibacteria bacterium]|nr:ATP-binding protein [Vicinamibacteria bacterium]